MEQPIITASDLLKMIRGLIEFPFPQICRHLVAADLLSLMEKRGWPVSSELAAAVVDADDEKALSLLPPA